MNSYTMRLLIISGLLSICFSLTAQRDIQIIIVTGGHGFDQAEFFGMFDRFEGVKYEKVVQPKANEMIESGQVEKYDLLIFYDMYDSITEGQKKAYLNLVADRKPMLFLHHSIVSYQDWPEFSRIVGGKYHTRDSSRLSNYKHDEQIFVKITDREHPITKGLQDFTILDETYGNCEILPDVHPLLSTDHPLSLPLLGWVNSYQGHQVVYLQGGHGPEAFKDPNFNKLLEQAIDWCTGK